MLDIRWLKGVYWVKHCIQLQLSDMECLVTMVVNKHNTEILLSVDPKGLEGIIQTFDKGTIVHSKFFIGDFGGVCYCLLQFVWGCNDLKHEDYLLAYHLLSIDCLISLACWIKSSVIGLSSPYACKHFNILGEAG